MVESIGLWNCAHDVPFGVANGAHPFLKGNRTVAFVETSN